MTNDQEEKLLEIVESHGILIAQLFKHIYELKKRIERIERKLGYASPKERR